MPQELSRLIWVIDQCVTMHFPFEYHKEKNTVRSVDVIGWHASDNQILSYLIENNSNLVTADYKFALRTLFYNKTVLFHKPSGERLRLELKTKNLSPSIKVENYDEITGYIAESDQVVIP